MKRLHVAAILLSMGIMGSPVLVRAGDLKMAMMSCSSGDELQVTIDGNDVNWEISDTNIAEISNGIITIKSEGQCDIVNTATGFKIHITSQGVAEDGNILSVDYSSETGQSSGVAVKDKTVSVKTVEKNATISTEEDAVPSNFSDQANSDNDVNNKIVSQQDTDASNLVGQVDVTANESGNYLMEDVSGNTEIIRVIDPQLNQYVYQGSVGQETDVYITNLEIPATFSSSNPEVATVDENGHVVLIDGGEAVIYVTTDNNVKECHITSVIPTVNTDDVEFKNADDTFQIEVENNAGNLPVEYYVVSGTGEIDENGLVSGVRGEFIVRVVVGDKYTYDKMFYYSTIHDDYWEAMQPSIQKCLGTPYVFGGEMPGVGLDCSGYVSYVYSHVGLMSGRDTAQGIYDSCIHTDNPQPGDLVFFTGTYDSDTYISHIGIYAGNGQMYHSGEPNCLADLNTPYWQEHLVGYGSMITEDSRGPVTTYYTGDSFNGTYDDSQMDLIYAIVAQECSTDYDGALAVITCAANRADINYGGYGTDILSQLTADGQFCYSLDDYWRARLNGNYDDFVVQAVNDCIVKGERNHRFVSFRSAEAEGRVNIGDNWYFNEF